MNQPEPKFASGDERTNRIGPPGGATTPDLPSAMPERLGKYRLEKELGRGGMGVVYQGWDESLHRHVAIKMISAAFVMHPDFFNRFRQEARAVARLNHPNIVAIYEFVEEADQPYLVMEFVDGADLSSLIRDQGPMSPEKALALTRQAALALQQAASVNLIHRDIKPANILVTRDGNTAKVMDFGLSKRADATEVSLTATGAIIGTPHYMSPEQARGESLDLRTDMYSLGCTLFTLLTGRKPYDSETLTGVLIKQVNEPLPIPREWERLYGGRLTAFLQRVTAKDRNQRFNTWGSLVADLDAMIAAGPRAPMRKAPGAGRAIPWKPIGIAGGVAVVVLVAAGIVATQGGGRSRPAPVAAAPKASGSPAAAAAAPVPTAAPPAVNPFNQTSDPAAGNPGDTPPPLPDGALPPPNEGPPAVRRAVERAVQEGRFADAVAAMDAQSGQEMSPMARRFFESIRAVLLRTKAVDDAMAQQLGAGSTPDQRQAQVRLELQNHARAGQRPGEKEWARLQYLYLRRDPEVAQLFAELQRVYPRFGRSPLEQAEMRMVQALVYPPRGEGPPGGGPGGGEEGRRPPRPRDLLRGGAP